MIVRPEREEFSERGDKLLHLIRPSIQPITDRLFQVARRRVVGAVERFFVMVQKPFCLGRDVFIDVNHVDATFWLEVDRKSARVRSHGVSKRLQRGTGTVARHSVEMIPVGSDDKRRSGTKTTYAGNQNRPMYR